MVFASAGSIRQSALRRRAIANMFLFDSAVSKDMLRGKNNLFSLASECRSMAYSFELDGIKTTPISGVKDNRFFPVFSGYVTQFNMGASNVTNYHDISSTTDVSTADERSDKFVTVQYQSAVAGQSGWSKYAGYMTQLRGMKTSVFPHFRIASTPNDPDCTFVLGAARCKSSIGTEMILIDIGDSSP